MILNVRAGWGATARCAQGVWVIAPYFAPDLSFFSSVIRTTLQALIAIDDNCDSLHSNAFDESDW